MSDVRAREIGGAGPMPLPYSVGYGRGMDLDTILANIATAAPRATLIRNGPKLAHVVKPNRVRATWILDTCSDGTVSGTLLDGRGHVIGAWNGITADEIVGQLS